MAFTENQLFKALLTVLERCAPQGSMPRGGQVEALERLLIHEDDVLLHQSTAWGKSAVFWAATLANRSKGRKATLQISPLLSLQRDQAASARKAGLKVVIINSETKKELDNSLMEIADGAADVVICTPEQVAKPNFAEWLSQYIALVVLDEAHCASDWGYSFRPEYSQLVQILNQLDDVRLLAATATAPADVIEDITYLFGGDLHVIQGPLENASLHRHVVRAHRPEKRLLILDAFLERQEEPGVIYVFEKRTAEELTAELKRSGHNVEAYHGDLSPSRRLLLEERWFDSDVTLVSTSALGVGIHKDHVPFVVNYGTPLTPTEFFQQSGRGGRDGTEAISLLLPDAASDNKRAREGVRFSMPSPDLIETVYRKMRKHGRPMTLSDAIENIGMSREQVTFNLKFLAAEGALHHSEDGYVCVQTDWEMNMPHWQQVLESRQHQAQEMMTYGSTFECLDRFIRQRVGEEMDRDYVCERCTNCMGLPRWLRFGI